MHGPIGMSYSPSMHSRIHSILNQCGAIAAGNSAVIKPSELTPACSALLAELFPKYMDPELYRIVNGGVEETTKVCSLRSCGNYVFEVQMYH